MARLIKAFWLLSLLVGLVVLLYTYAGLPENVVYDLESSIENRASLGKEAFFYISLAVLVITNFALYTVSRSLHYKKESFNALMTNWQLSLAGVLNFFFIVLWNFVGLMNSGEVFNYDHYGFLIYISVGLILIWALALPVLLIRHQMTS